MVYLDVHVTYQGIRTLIRSIEVDDCTPDETSAIIVKQHSLLDGCDCTIRRVPDVEITIIAPK